MKISKNLSFKCFKKNNYNQQSYNKARKLFYDLLDENNETIKSFSTNYSYSFNKNIKHKLKNHKIFNLIGMGGSSLGMRSIYSFLKKKLKKKFFFLII
jgi:glucose-6-phosphate isomerase